MQNIFHFDSKVIRFGNKVTDLMILQLLTVVFSLPVITIGPAFTAMHDVLLKMYRKQDPSVIPTFWAAFKQNFRQATLIWLFYLLFFLFLGLDLYLFLTAEDVGLRIIIYALPVPALVGIFSLNWVFVLLSRYENTIWNTIKLSLALCVRHPLKTLSMTVLMTAALWIGFLSQHTIPFLLLLGITVPGFLRTITYSQVFDQLEDTDWRKELDSESDKERTT